MGCILWDDELYGGDEEIFPKKRKFTNMVQFVAEVDGVYVVALQI
jgi:hypothetical protein